MTSTAVAADADAAVDTLVTVNGEAVTTADMDALIMAAHTHGDMEGMTTGQLFRLFRKTVNDRLLIQEAEAIGLDDEYAVRSRLAEQLAEDARTAYLKDHFAYTAEVTEDEVGEYFATYYWKVQIRQLSVRTLQRADSLRTAILAGADMDELAREHSLDTHSLHGGAHNLKYWADVENEIRDAARDLEIGELSQPFPYRDSRALVRVEARHEVDWEALPTYRSDILAYLVSQKRQVEWRAYLDRLAATIEVSSDRTILAAIDADSAQVIRGEFLAGSERPVLSTDTRHRDEFQVRQAISHAAMNDGLAAYTVVRDRALQAERDVLLLDHAAAAAGYRDDPAVQRAHAQRREQVLIEAYLDEFIAPNIVFSRDEFQAVYDEYQDRFRGPDQVRLDTIVLRDETTAQALVFRLREGADFDFVAEQYADDPHVNASKGAWASETMFSEPIRMQLAAMAAGDTGDPVAIPTGWLVFQMAGRRPGPVRSLEEVDMQVRRILYQKKFTALLDEHLELLRRHSEIDRDEDAITRYFGEGF